MTRIEKKFSELKEAGKKAFIAYITAGDPSWEKTAKMIPALEKAGVDILELGIPFSDPMADGPAIQAAGERALKTGITVNTILNGVKEIRKECEIPILLFTYFNPPQKYGLEKFAETAREAGADGALMTDLTPESAGEYKDIMDKNRLNTVFLTAPTTPDERLEKITKLCSGFVYYVSRTGVTGVRDSLETAIGEHVQRIRKFTDLPVAVGFGVSTPEHVSEVSDVADGVVVGSAIVKKIEETNGDAAAVHDFVKNLAAPLK